MVSPEDTRTLRGRIERVLELDCLYHSSERGSKLVVLIDLFEWLHRRWSVGMEALDARG